MHSINAHLYLLRNIFKAINTDVATTELSNSLRKCLLHQPSSYLFLQIQTSLSALHDKTIIKESDKLIPERYVKGGNARRKIIISFGLGRRACGRKSLAKIKLFLFYTSILPKYSLYLTATSLLKDL